MAFAYRTPHQIKLLQEACALLHELHPGIRQIDLPDGAVKETYAEIDLQVCHNAAWGLVRGPVDEVAPFLAMTSTSVSALKRASARSPNLRR